MYCKHCYTESPNTSPRCIQCGEAFFDDEEPHVISPKPPEKKFSLGIEGMVALAVGWYSGVIALFLVLAAIPFWWLGKKLLRPAAQVYGEALAAQAGQVIFIVSATVSLAVISKVSVPVSSIALGVMLDMLIPSLGICWLALRPGLKPVVFLSGYQIFALVVNVIGLLEMSVGTQGHKAFAAHIVWRLIALSLMWKALLNRKHLREEVLSPCDR